MRANEFVKKFGWRDAISCIKSCAKPEERWIMHWGSLVADSDFDELKRLVESYELVKNHNGISPCKFWVSMMDGCDAYQNKVDLFKRAIADVESINDY